MRNLQSTVLFFFIKLLKVKYTALTYIPQLLTSQNCVDCSLTSVYFRFQRLYTATTLDLFQKSQLFSFLPLSSHSWLPTIWHMINKKIWKPITKVPTNSNIIENTNQLWNSLICKHMVKAYFNIFTEYNLEFHPQWIFKSAGLITHQKFYI